MREKINEVMVIQNTLKYGSKSIRILSIFLLLSIGINATPLVSTDSLTRFVQNIHTYNRMFPREQVYLHFDNTGYFMGENIWFKAYVVSPQGFRPSALSRVLYVELLTPEGRIVQQQKLKIVDGQCDGMIPLGKLLHAGFYEVRAYTALMLNWEEENVFSRVFPIFNAPKDEGVYDNPRMVKLSHTERLPDMRKQPLKADALNMSFFPEGGKLVEGLPSTLFFKATDKRGNTLAVQGQVFDQQGVVMGTFSTSHDGMGRIVLTPNRGESYYAEVTIEGNSVGKRFNLPMAEQQGYVMSVNNMRDENVTIQLARNEQTDTTTAVGLTIMCRGQVVMFRQIDWQGRNTALLNIRKESLPEGVNQLTLFDTKGRIHAERLCFIFPKQDGNIFLVGEKSKELKPKENVSLDFRVTDNDGHPLVTTFSLSVRDADTDTPTNGIYGGNIMTNLLLGSELKGYIHNIDYYLEANDRTHRMHLDMLLCTQGWRKYDWTEMTRPNEFEVKYPVEEGIMVMGNLTSTFRNRKKEGVKMKVFLFNEAGDKRTGSAITDSLGHFAFLADDFTGRWQMNMMTYEKDKLEEMNVNLHKVQGPQGRIFGKEETSLFFRQKQTEETVSFQPDTIVKYKAEEKRRWENLLPSVKVEAQKEWQSDFIRRWNNLIYDMEDERMRMDETGEEYLEDYWDWLLKTNPFVGYVVQGKDEFVPAYKSRPIKFLISRAGTGSWILQPGESSGQEFGIQLEDLTVNDVEAIAICDKPDANLAFMELSRSEYFGDYLYDPVLDPLNRDSKNYVFVTLFVREDYFRYKDKRGHRKTKIQGFSPERKFYTPDYSYADLPNEQDFRRTLYWNPNVRTDSEGKATVKFYNSPTCRHIKVNAETITKEGEWGIFNDTQF